jgi:hypothetical protein
MTRLEKQRAAHVRTRIVTRPAPSCGSDSQPLLRAACRSASPQTKPTRERKRPILDSGSGLVQRRHPALNVSANESN